ncbi:hypothetical protein, partial [Streptomyces sp. NPDC004976]
MADTPETLRQPEADRPATHAVRLSLNGPGLATVEVDGQDHSSAVTGYSLSGSATRAASEGDWAESCSAAT